MQLAHTHVFIRASCALIGKTTPRCSVDYPLDLRASDGNSSSFINPLKTSQQKLHNIIIYYKPSFSENSILRCVLCVRYLVLYSLYCGIGRKPILSAPNGVQLLSTGFWKAVASRATDRWVVWRRRREFSSIIRFGIYRGDAFCSVLLE